MRRLFLSSIYMNYLHLYILKTFSALFSYSLDENIQFLKIALVHPNEMPSPPKVVTLLSLNSNINKLSLK
jgi:hypothetical protein